jgi:transcriptional regulator with GAF, ATPase, and Fis domain
VGYYHLSFDLTENVSNLPEWLEKLTNNLQQAHQEDADLYQPLNILLPPQQQMIGDSRSMKSLLLPIQTVYPWNLSVV